MSTIKPLATIAVLAALGVFLALEINKQGPVSLDTGWDTGTSGEASDAAALTDAPTFEGSAMNGSANGSSATEAPTFDPSQASALARTAPGGQQASALGTSNTSALPALPELPAMPIASPAPAAAQQPATATTTDQELKLPALIPQASYQDSASPAVNQSASAAIVGSVPSLGTSTGVEPKSAYNQTANQTSVNPSAYPSATPNLTPRYEPSETTPISYNAANSYSATTPTMSAPATDEFTIAWGTIQEALRRNELTRAHLLATQWYGASTLTPAQKVEVDTLLSELAGTVVYSLEHRLEPPYTVRAGETLETIAQQYQIPWELLAKINGISTSDGIQTGQQLKVVRGPFEAEVVLSSSELVLMLDDRFAGKFPIQIDGVISSSTTWRVDQKQVVPSGGTMGKMLVLRNDLGASFALSDMPTPAQMHQGQLRVASNDASDLYDILSVGSVISIRR